MITYSLEKILGLEKNNKFVLDESTLNCLKDIDSLVGSPNYVKTPRFNHSCNNYENSKWENFRTFKKTVIINKDSTDFEKCKFDVRDSLNKLTDNTYEAIRKKIFSIMDDLTDDDMKVICPVMFDIMSSNIFYSGLYTSLFKEMIERYEIVLSIFKSNFSNFLNIFKKIEYISSDDNYNEFCKINKTNEKRRAQSKFFSNLMLKKIIPKENILKIVLTLQERIILYISDDESKHIIEEIIENIYIIFDTIYKSIDDDNELMKLIITNVKWLLDNQNDYISVSNKAVFKYMDILDHLNIEY